MRRHPTWLFRQPPPSPHVCTHEDFVGRMYAMLAAGWKPSAKNHEVLENNQWPRIWWKVDAYPVDPGVRAAYGHIVGAVCMELEEAMADTERRVAMLNADWASRH